MTRLELSTREKKIVAVLVTLIVIYMFHRLLWIPFSTHMWKLGRQVEVEEKRLAAMAKTIQKAQSLEQRYGAYLPYFDQQEANEQVMSTLLAGIESITDAGDIRVSDVKPQPVRTDDVYNTFAVSMSVEGDLPEVLHFIHRLQQPPAYYTVGDLQILRAGTNRKVRCSLQVSKTMFSVDMAARE